MSFLKRRSVIVGGLAAGICFLSGFLVSYELPKLRSFMLVKIEEISRDKLPVRILPGKIDVSFIPLGTTLTNVRILPKKGEVAADIIERAAIDTITVNASPWQLLAGRLRLSEVIINGADIAATVPVTEKKSGPPLDGLFDLLQQIPVSHLELNDVSLKLSLKEPRALLDITRLNLVAEKQFGGAVYLNISSLSALGRDPVTKASVRIDGETQLTLARDSIVISNLKVRRGDSFISTQGRLVGNTEALKFKEMDFQTDSEIQIESMRNWAVATFKNLSKVPTLKGRAFVHATVKKNATEPLQADFQAHTEEFQMRKMLFGKLTANGHVEKETLKIPELKLENSSGLISVEDVVADLSGSSKFTGHLKTDSLQLHDLLKTLGVGDLAVYSKLKGDLPCTGTAEPFLIHCKGGISADDILVRADVKAKSTIVAVKKIEATGEVTVDADKVTYTSALTAPHSRGLSSGTIIYDEGFKINYESDHLAMEDVANLADLKLEGALKLKGSTEGDSDAATLSMNAEGSDVWLEDFWLGNPKTEVAYADDHLTFSNLTGYYSVSRYSGDVNLNLGKNEIAVNARVPFFDARDLLNVFSRKVKLGIPITGTGQATIKTSGPLALNKLSYDLKSSLFKGTVGGETFDQAHFDVKSIAGEVKSERVDMIKAGAVINLTGVGHPDGTIKTAITGRGLKLEDSAIVGSTGLAVSGAVDFDMKMEGPVLAPDTDLQGKLTKTSIGDQGVPDSDFKLKFRSKSIEGQGTLLGNTVKTDFVIPLQPSAPFSLKVATNEWNYAPLFAAISGPTSRKDYEGRLTSNINISSANGGLWNSTGSIKIDRFSLSRGSLALRSNEPLSMSMKNGQLHVEHFDLSGDNVFLKIVESPNPVSKVDLQVNGKIDLTLIALLTPFFEDMRGILSFAFNLRTGPTTTELLGSAYIDKAYLKFFGFPHPIENLSIDLLFNQRKILFNTIKAELGGGRISGTGGMELKGYKNYPVNVSGTFDKVSLEIPDKIRTNGSGTLSFTGNWFPFVLKVDYDVKDGMVTKEFGGDATENDGIRRDFFLPEMLLAENFTPVLLDVGITFDRGIIVKNDLVDGRVLGSLSIKGKPTKPSVLGALTTGKDTNIIVKDTLFEVISSNIQFQDPAVIDPKLYVAARSRVQNYDITLLIQGHASKPELSFSSVPPMAEKDIISLLAIGATDNSIGTSVKASEGTASTLNMGSGVIKKNAVTNLIKDSIGFDVQFAPGFDETGNSAVQKIIVSRKFNQRFDLTASRSIGGAGQETQARARYRLNDRVSVIGSWLGRDYTETITTDTNATTVVNPNAFGLDLEYKFEFK